MKMIHHYINHQKISIMLLSLAALFIVACVQPQQKLRKEINAEEKKLFADHRLMLDTASAHKIISLYMKYADTYQDDTLTPEMLFRAADVHQGLSQWHEAMITYNRILRYKNYRKRPETIFMQAFIAENNMQDTTTAGKFYRMFLNEYPEHHLALDARMSLENLGKPTEEILKHIE